MDKLQKVYNQAISLQDQARKGMDVDLAVCEEAGMYDELKSIIDSEADSPHPLLRLRSNLANFAIAECCIRRGIAKMES
jgi:hypothetical protein